MPRTVAVTLSLLFTLTALPATLTQERRVVPIGPLTRAANSQFQPAIASNGHGFLAIWLDGRANHAVYRQTGSLLWASHLAVDGTPTSAAGFKLADGVFDARIASDGNGYLIATERSDGIYTQAFDDEGHALTDAVKMNTPTTTPMMLASNGSGYLLAMNDLGGVLWLTLDRLGRPIGDPQVLFASNASDNTAIVVTSDAAYHLIYVKWGCLSGIGCTYAVSDVAVTNGKAAPARTLVPPSSFLGPVSAASSGDQIMVAWSDAAGIHDQLFDSSDNALTAAQRLAPAVLPSVTVSWDGARYLVSYTNGDMAIVGQRFGRDGALIDATPFVIANAAGHEAFARGGGRTAVVWSSADAPPDVYGRVVFDFNELAATNAEPLRLSRAPSAAHPPAAASIAGRTIRVWRGGDGFGSIQMAIDGGAAVVLSAENGDNQHDPDVAAIGDVALIVWRSDSRSLRRVLGIRVDANGNRLDPSPIVIDQDSALGVGPFPDTVSVATDGQTFFAAWSGSHYVVAAKRIAKDGSILDAAPIVASHNDFFLTAGVRAVWNGTMYVVVFAFQDNQLTLHPPIELVKFYAARVTSSGVALDTDANRPVYEETGAVLDDLSVAAAGNRIVIAFSELSAALTSHCDVRTLEISADPPPLPVASQLVAQLQYPFTYGVPDVAVAARGNTFLVAWTQDGPNGSEVRAQLLDRGESFTVSEDDAYDVNAIPGANGFSFTYARTDPDAYDVAQLFTRDLVMTPERHRAVR